MVRKLFRKIIISLSLVICALGAYSQMSNGCSIVVKNPTCPIPSNAAITFNFKNLDAGGNPIYTSDSLKVRLQQTKTGTYALDTAFEIISGVTEYTCIVDSLPYDYSDAGVKKQHEYFATFVYGGKTVFYEFVYFDKPEYSAALSLVRGAGCTGQPIGEAGVTFNQGVPPYAWDWYKVGDATPTKHNLDAVDGLALGNYFVRVSDSEGCTINSDTVQVKPENMHVIASVDQNVTCKGEATGKISFSPIKNAGDYTTKINSVSEAGINLTSKSSLLAGPYTITLTDTLGCSADTTITITEPALKLTLQEDSRVNLLCREIPTGSISYSPLNAIGAVTYEWADDHTITVPSRSNLQADVAYTITAKDEAECVTTESVTLTQPASKVKVTVVTEKQPTCFGGTDGSITVSATGGTGSSYSYFWNGFVGTATKAGIPAGVYTIVAIDINGCSDTIEYTLSQPQSIQPHLTINGNEVDNLSLPCNGQTAVMAVTATGGQGQKTYNWGDGVYGTITTKTVTAGDYTIKVKDEIGCEESVSASITQPEKLTLAIVEDSTIYCNGEKGRLRANPAGGISPYTYSWSSGSTSSNTGLVLAGTYNVVITDSHGCSISDSHALPQPNALQLPITETQPSCFGATDGALTVTASGGTGSSYSYFWNGFVGIATKSDIPAGEYTVVVIDINGCSDTVVYTLNQPQSIQPHLTINGNEVDFLSLPCNGQTAAMAVTAAGGIGVKTYNWGDGVYGSITAKTVPAGDYTIKVRDAKGCEESVSASITQPEKLTLAIEETSIIHCNGDKGILSANVTGGTTPYTYSWSSGSTNLSTGLVGPGTYNVVVTDANGCTTSDSHTLTKPNALNLLITLAEQTCTNPTLGSLSPQVSGGTTPYSYAWYKKLTGGSLSLVATTPSLTNMEQKAEYKLVITDNNGCLAADSVDMKKISSYQVNPKQDMPVSCPVTIDNKSTDPNTNDGKLLVNIVGGFIPFYVKISSTGTYKDFTNVNEGDDTLGYWNNNEKASGARPTEGIARVRIDSLPIGTYTIDVTDYRGCAKTKSFSITNTPGMTITEMSITPSACTKPTGTATIAVTGGKAFNNLGVKYYEYQWDNGGDTAVVSGLSIGKHIVKVNDVNGCIKRDTVEIVKKSALRLTAIPISDVVHCVGGETGSAKTNVYYEGDTSPHTYSFVWTDGIYNTSTGNVTNLPKGIHKVTVTDDDGCTRTDSVTVIEADILQMASVSSQNLVCYGDNSGQIVLETIKGGVLPYSILWNTGATSTMLNNIPADTYSVTVSDASGCSADTTIIITEPQKVTLTKISQADVVCPRLCDGSAEIQAQGGTGSYLYTWDGVESTETHNTNLCFGDHFVSAVDAEGCLSDTMLISIAGQTEKLRVTSAAIVQPTCGETTPSGSISVTAAGSANGSYNYSWLRNGAPFPETTPAITGLTVGVYSVHVTDGFCSFDTTFSLSSVMSATSSLMYQSSACNGDSYKIDISNATTAGYTSFRWYNDLGALVSSDTTAYGLKTGAYTITAEDNTSCTFSASYSIVQKVLSVTATGTEPTCYGSIDGQLSATVAGNFAGAITYTWYDATNSQIGVGQVHSNVGAGSYYVTAYDLSHAACPIKSNILKVSQPKLIKAVASVVKPSYCNLKNGEVKVDILNGFSPYTYSWKTSTDALVQTSSGKTALSDTCKGVWTNEIFTVQVVDKNGCMASTMVQVPNVSNFSLTGLQLETVHCPGDSTASLEVFTINGYAPFSYKWSHDATIKDSIAVGLPAGLYTAEVTDNKGCVVKYDFDSVTDAKPLTVTVLETPEIICKGGTGNLSAKANGTTAPFTYKWYSNEGVLLSQMQQYSNVSAGVYKVMATDKYGCESSLVPYTFEEPTMIEAEFSMQVTGCGASDATGYISLDTIYGGLEGNEYYFRWTTEASIGDWQPYVDGKDWRINNLKAGMYICTISNATDFLSCNISKEFHTNPSMPVSIETAKTPTQCSYYTSQQLDENKPSGSIEVTKLVVSEGDYTVQTEDSPANYTYEWNDTRNQTGVKATNLPIGTYQVTVTGTNGCIKSFSAGDIGSLVNLEAKISSVGDSILNRKQICLEDSVQLKANTITTFADGYSPVNPIPNTYEWSSIEQNKTSLISSPYAQTTWVTPETTAYTDSSRVSVIYSFDGCVSRPGYYTIAHYDSVGFALEVIDSLGMYLGVDSVTVMKGVPYLINPVQEPWFVNQPEGEDGIVSIAWHSYKPDFIEKGAIPDKVTNETTYKNTGYYGLYTPFIESNYFRAVATTTHGCRERAVVYINIFLDDFVPSGFSPNGDGINDTWVIPKLANCPKAKVTVYNRWGAKVYQNKLNYSDSPWNGDSMNGNALPMGTYYYVIEFNDQDNTPDAVGPISILR